MTLLLNKLALSRVIMTLSVYKLAQRRVIMTLSAYKLALSRVNIHTLLALEHWTLSGHFFHERRQGIVIQV